jgi:DhnA family fructose-bisphosphate aldolase class Ia
MTSPGKSRRLRKMFNAETNIMLCIPIDHGMQVGPIDGLSDPDRLIGEIADGGADAVIVNPGLMRRFYKQLERIPTVILRMDQTTMWRTGGPFGYEATYTRRVSDVTAAVEMGAEAVITYLFTCNKDPLEVTKCFEINRDISRQCDEFGIVHVIEAMAANGGFARADDPEVVLMNCRIASELGADIVKTDWCGAEGMAKAVQNTLAPIAIAGGGKAGSLAELMDTVRAGIASGATGFMFGRNTFQRDDVRKTVQSLRDTITEMRK